MMPRLALALALVSALAGCSGDDEDSDGVASATTNPGTSGGTSGGTSMGPSTDAETVADSEGTTDATTTGATTAATMTTSMVTNSSTSGTTDDPTTTTTTTTTTTGPACDEPPFDPDPVGEVATPCSGDVDCPGGQVCFVIPLLGGLCGECTSDADCPEGGCTVPDPIHSIGAVCNTGKPGGGCESDAVCDSTCHDLCSVALDAAPILTIKTCGACNTSADCPDGRVCAPDLDVGAFTGITECVAPGSLGDGESCSLKGDGAEACASGRCASANVMGIIQVGVCSECLADGECGPGQTCADAAADLEAGVLIPATCQ